MTLVPYRRLPSVFDKPELSMGPSRTSEEILEAIQEGLIAEMRECDARLLAGGYDAKAERRIGILRWQLNLMADRGRITASKMLIAATWAGRDDLFVNLSAYEDLGGGMLPRFIWRRGVP